MSIRPGAIVLTVMPSGPSSRASVFSQPTTPGRTAFESARFAIGSFTDVDSIATMRPRPLARRWGRQSATSRTCGVEQELDRRLDGLGVDGRGGAGGGPPPLRTRTSMPPNASTVACDEALEVCGIGQVALDGERADPRRLALEHVAAAGEHRHVRALGGERLGDREAHALRGAADDRASVPEVRGPWRAKRTRTDCSRRAKARSRHGHADRACVT